MKVSIGLGALLVAVVAVLGAAFIYGVSANALWVVVLGLALAYLSYRYYASNIDSQIIQADAKKATPARLYMDGVDFMPTSRNVLYGYHFKSIAAAGPIVGVITAALLWGWLPALLWLVIGVSFIGWVSDYSAIMMAVRNDGNSLSAVAYKLIAPRTRTILFVFIFFYLLLVASAFVGILASTLDGTPTTGLAVLALMIIGLLTGQALYKWKMDLVAVTIVAVALTLLVIVAGPLGNTYAKPGDAAPQAAGPVWKFMADINKGINQTITGGYVEIKDASGKVTGTRPKELLSFYDPTPNAITGAAGGSTGAARSYITPSLIFWALFTLVFSYLGSVLPIWRFAQPVNYLGFWITALAIAFTFLGAAVSGIGSFLGISALSPDVSKFVLPAWKGFNPGQGGMAQPLWPMLFVTIACGAISGWHALIGSVGTSRQLEFETDALPVGGGGMLTENMLALTSLLAVSVAGAGAGGGRFAQGIGKFLSVFGLHESYGRALGFAAFVIIVLTVVQLVFRVMRVTLTEWIGEAVPVVRSMHVSTIISMILAFLLVISGTWIYLWQLFGTSNQLMAALSLLLVTMWLVSTKKNAFFAAIPMIFMYLTTMAAIVVTAYNMWNTVLFPQGKLQSEPLALLGGIAMVLIAILLFVCAAIIAWDAWKAYQGLQGKPLTAEPRPAT